MGTHASSRRPRGRPRNDGLRKEILLAARRLFVTNGAAVSLDAIASEAETTKVTLYSHFGSKEELLKAMLVEEVMNSLNFTVEHLDTANPRAALTELANTYLDLVLARETVENMTVLIAAPKLDLKIPAAYHRTGLLAVITAMAWYLARVPQLDIPVPEFAAEQLVSMLRGNEQIRALLGLPPLRNAADSQAYIESCIDLFLRGCTRPA